MAKMKGSTTKHTPGPWRTGREDAQSYDGATGEPFSSVYTDDARAGTHMGERLPLVIARVPGNKIPRGEEKANARLIAAAPEMADLIRRIARERPDVAEAVTARALLARLDA